MDGWMDKWVSQRLRKGGLGDWGLDDPPPLPFVFRGGQTLYISYMSILGKRSVQPLDR